MRHPILALAAACAAAAAFSVPVTATPPPEEPDPERCSQQNFDLCLDGVGSGVTSLDSLRVSSGGTARARAEAEDEESARTGAALGGQRMRGMAAGEGMLSGWNVWGSFARSDYESDVAIAPYEGETNNFLVGLDRLVGDRWVVGLSLGYENTSTETRFNGGEQDVDGVIVAPYLVFLVDDVFSIDASAGYAGLETDQTRLDPATGAALVSSFDARRAFFTANANAVVVRGNWVLGARAGALHAVESQDAYVESGGPSARAVRSRHVDLTQVYVGADVAYGFGPWEPYAIAAYHNDVGSDDGSGAGGLPGAVGSTQPDDDDEFQAGLGVRYFGASGITGSLEWLRTFDRSKFDNDTFTLTVRVPL